jgi:hypothetical protein
MKELALLVQFREAVNLYKVTGDGYFLKPELCGWVERASVSILVATQPHTICI